MKVYYIEIQIKLDKVAQKYEYECDYTYLTSYLSQITYTEKKDPVFKNIAVDYIYFIIMYIETTAVFITENDHYG